MYHKETKLDFGSPSVRENRNEFFVPAKSLCLGLVFFEKPEPDDL